MTTEIIFHIIRTAFENIKEFYYFKEIYDTENFRKLMNKYIDNQKDLIKIIIEKYNLPDDFMHDIIIDFLESYKKNINDLFSQKPE